MKRNDCLRNIWCVTSLVFVLMMFLTFSSRAESSEQDFTDVFCEYVSGDTKHVFPDRTRPDCIDDKYAYEVDWGTGPKVYEGVGQALHYATVSGLKPGLVIIKKDEKSLKYIERASKIEVCPKISIWTIDEKHNIMKIK